MLNGIPEQSRQIGTKVVNRIKGIDTPSTQGSN